MLTAVAAPSRSPVRSQRLCYLFFLFLAGCLVGWVYEELFYWASEGLLRNRGVLYGPWLPIYGVGALVIYAMKPLKRRPALLFALCVAATGLVEYLIGWVGIHCLGLRLWDYRGLLGSIDGIVCLRSVLSFGVGHGLPLPSGAYGGAALPALPAPGQPGPGGVPGADPLLRLRSQRPLPDAHHLLRRSP